MIVLLNKQIFFFSISCATNLLLNLNAVILIFQDSQVTQKSLKDARNKNQGSISGLAMDRRTRA